MANYGALGISGSRSRYVPYQRSSGVAPGYHQKPEAGALVVTSDRGSLRSETMQVEMGGKQKAANFTPEPSFLTEIKTQFRGRAEF